jgi:colanic acid biosynthesis glycosyl transferase WcaI
MRLLIYSANFAPEPTGIGKYSGEMAVWLAAQGHDVRVVCAPPYYPAWRLGAFDAWPRYRREYWHGVDVWRAPLWVPRQPGGARRLLHLASFALSSLPVVLRQAAWRPQVVITVAPALFCAPAGWLTARLAGGKAWLHVQDFEVDVAFGMGLLRGGRLRRFVEVAERALLRRFDRVSSIGRRMCERLVEKGVAPERVRPLPNWVDVAALRPLVRPSAYRAELGIADDAVVALFSGTLGAKQALHLIPQAAQLLAHRREIVFVVCGDGVMKPELERLGAGLPNLHLLPLQPAERLRELLGLADVHLLTQSPEAEDLVLPSKLSGMLASGRPVVATVRPGTEVAELLLGCGLVVPPGSAAALARAVADLADDPELRLRMGARAEQVVESSMSADRVLAALDEHLELVRRSPSERSSSGPTPRPRSVPGTER